jgi:hypothetical protein
MFGENGITHYEAAFFTAISLMCSISPTDHFLVRVVAEHMLLVGRARIIE